MSSLVWHTDPETGVAYRVACTKQGEWIYQIDNDKSEWLSKADFDRQLERRVPRYPGYSNPSDSCLFPAGGDHRQEPPEPISYEVSSGDGIALSDAVASIRRGSAYELGPGVGPGNVTQLSSLARSFIGLGLGRYSESADFIADNPSILRKSEIEALIAEASTAEKAGQSTKAQTCIHQALLLRECERVGASNVSSFCRKLTAKDGRAKEAFVKDVKKEYVAIQEQAGSTTPQSQGTTSGNTQSQTAVARGKSGGLRYPDTRGNILRPASSHHEPTRRDPDRHRSVSDPVGMTERTAALSIGEGTQTTTTAIASRRKGTAPLHRSVTSDSNRPLPTVAEDQKPGTSGPGGNGASPKKLDERYRVVQRDATKFFERGQVFAVPWDEPAGNGGGRGSKRGPTVPSDHTFIRNQFGEPVYSHIRRMVVVKEGHGCCICLAINTYHGQGVTKPGFSEEDKRAHSIVYMTGTEPRCLPDEKQYLDKKAIAVNRASQDQKLDPMSRLNYSKVYTVEHNLKVMAVGRVTTASLPALLGYWRNTMDGHD